MKKNILHRPLWKPLVGLLAILAVAGFLFLKPTTKRPSDQPFELGVWYWHSPLSLTVEEASNLKSRGIDRLFVRAGTFSNDGKNAKLVIPQTYRGAPEVETHLVFNFDAGFVRHFEDFDLKLISKQIATQIDNQILRVQKLGIQPVGIQLDLDCPTRLLPLYAELVKIVRGAVPGKLQWSTTGLMSWLGTSGVETLSAELDFIVPQAYEGVTGRTLDEIRPVSDPEYLKSVLPKAEKLRCPYFIGVPAYGHGFLFDAKDRLVDIYQNIGPSEVMIHPSFKFQEAYPTNRLGTPAKGVEDSVGEQIITLKAIRPSPDGRGLDHTLAFTVPAPEVLQKAMAVVRENAGPKCRGMIIYRYPEPKSTLTLSSDGFLATVAGEKLEPRLEVSTDSIQDNFDLIEGGTKAENAPTDFFITISNPSPVATFVSPDAVQLLIEFNRKGVEGVRLRDFEGVEFGNVGANGEFHSSPKAQANAVRLTKSYLGSKQRASAGPIRLFESGAQIKQFRWIIRNANGFDRHQGSDAPPLESTRKPLK